MRRRTLMCSLLVTQLAGSGLLGYSHAADPQAGHQVTGRWVGTWQGSGIGDFVLEFQLGSDGVFKGGAQIGSDDGSYTVTFATLVFQGSRMHGRYDYPYAYPLDVPGEIIVEGDFEASKASGKWHLVRKGGSEALLTGTWRVQKE